MAVEPTTAKDAPRIFRPPNLSLQIRLEKSPTIRGCVEERVTAITTGAPCTASIQEKKCMERQSPEIRIQPMLRFHRAFLSLQGGRNERGAKKMAESPSRYAAITKAGAWQSLTSMAAQLMAMIPRAKTAMALVLESSMEVTKSPQVPRRTGLVELNLLEELLQGFPEVLVE